MEEQFEGNRCQRKYYQVVHRDRRGDHGLDLELTSPAGQQAVAQCKLYQNTVTEEFVRVLHETAINKRMARAFIVTKAKISNAAQFWARGKRLILTDGLTLVQMSPALAEIDTC